MEEFASFDDVHYQCTTVPDLRNVQTLLKMRLMPCDCEQCTSYEHEIGAFQF